ncbi:hypothetical protein ABZX51_011393 [Aspergillus tubingensis]
MQERKENLPGAYNPCKSGMSRTWKRQKQDKQLIKKKTNTLENGPSVQNGGDIIEKQLQWRVRKTKHTTHSRDANGNSNGKCSSSSESAKIAPETEMDNNNRTPFQYHER